MKLPMLDIKNLTSNQVGAVDHIYSTDNTLLVADMGAGKTVVALTAASELLRDGHLKRILVISTIKVAKNVWATEPKIWKHLKHLNIDLALGDEKTRRLALGGNCEIVCINFENLAWLSEFYGSDLTGMFDGLIIDEVSKLKSNSGTNFKKMKKHIKKFNWRLTMTGTPVSEDWTGLYGEMFMTDGGDALGKSKQKYLDKYFYPTDYERRNWKLIPNMDEKILNKIGDVLYHLPDYRHELPELIEYNILTDMNAHMEILYNNFKRDCIAQLNDAEIIAPNAAALSGKLQQIAQGFMYSPDGSVNLLDALKIARLKELLKIRGGGSLGPARAEPPRLSPGPVVIVYWFKQDLTYLTDAFPSGVQLDGAQTIADWNAGKIPILFLQPRSAGHGLNLARGGSNMVFYSPLWSNDLVKQTIARLWRRGQKDVVRVFHLLMRNTVDELISARIDDKTQYHALLIKHLTAQK